MKKPILYFMCATLLGIFGACNITSVCDEYEDWRKKGYPEEIDCKNWEFRPIPNTELYAYTPDTLIQSTGNTSYIIDKDKSHLITITKCLNKDVSGDIKKSHANAMAQLKKDIKDYYSIRECHLDNLKIIPKTNLVISCPDIYNDLLKYEGSIKLDSEIPFETKIYGYAFETHDAIYTVNGIVLISDFTFDELDIQTHVRGDVDNILTCINTTLPDIN